VAGFGPKCGYSNTLRASSRATLAVATHLPATTASGNIAGRRRRSLASPRVPHESDIAEIAGVCRAQDWCGVGAFPCARPPVACTFHP